MGASTATSRAWWRTAVPSSSLLPSPNHFLPSMRPLCLPPSHSDVSGNSLYGRINRDFKGMVANSGALVNLARNFFFGEAMLFAAGCKVCPTEVSEPNNLSLKDTSNWRVSDGKCNNALPSYLPKEYYAVAGAGLKLSVSLSGNCLTLSPNAECSVNATQRSTAACQAFCSITDNGPCDGHGVCVPAAPASSTNFTCLCEAGYSSLDSGNGSTCAIVNSTTTTVSSLSTGAIVGIALGCFAGFILLAFVVAWLLWPRGRTKVADFGLLKRLTHGDSDATRVAGTPGYVDPDYNRTNVITAKSDVFSFGIVLLELLSGKSAQVDTRTHIRKWAMKLVEAYEVDELKDSKMPAVSEEAIVDFADLALDCIKSPGTRRPTMKDVAYRLSALIDKHCPDREDEWESVAKEESEGNKGMSSRDVSAVSFGDGGRESERSHGSQSGVSTFVRIGSIGDGLKSWLQLKPTKGR
ncbi:unnamed protein product [Closterium sp. Yama58-4]|nr:unnamed protein product [Closterium sp. Yama58-4]